MGNRVVVSLLTDLAHRWEEDGELGKKIMRTAQMPPWSWMNSSCLNHYGHIIELAHGDTQSLVAFDHYNGRVLGYGSYNRARTEQPDDVALKLLKDAADRLGYRLVKKTVRK